MTAGKPESWDEISAQIIRASANRRREGVWMAASMAMVSSIPEHIAFASREVGDFLRDPDARAIEESDMLCLPLALSACGDLESAIGISQRILDKKKDTA